MDAGRRLILLETPVVVARSRRIAVRATSLVVCLLVQLAFDGHKE